MDITRKACALILCGLLVATTAVPAVSGYPVYAGEQRDVVVDEDLTAGMDSADEVIEGITDESADKSTEKDVIDEQIDATPESDEQKKEALKDDEEADKPEVTANKSAAREAAKGLAGGEPVATPMDAGEPYAKSTPASGEVDGLTNNIMRIDWFRGSNGKIYAKIFGDFDKYRAANEDRNIHHYEAYIRKGSVLVWDSNCEIVRYPGMCTTAIFTPGDTLNVYFYGAIKDGRCACGEGDSSETPWTVTVPVPDPDPYDPNKPDFYDAQSLKLSSTAVKTARLVWDIDCFGGKSWPTGYNVFVDGKLVQKTSGWNERNAEISIPYNKSVQVYVSSYYIDSGGTTWWGIPTNTVTVKGKTIGNAKVSRATRLSSNKVCIHVSKPSGATGVVVYKGSKKIKTLKSSGSFRYSAKNAGKSSYRARAYITSGGKNYYTSYSKLKKTVSNTATWSSAGKHNARDSGFRYPSVHFYISKVYYSKGSLKATGYLYNTRIFTLKGSKIRVTIHAEGKTITKTVKVSTRIGEYGKKKITVSLGKRSAYDLRSSSWYTDCEKNNWGYGWES